MKIVIVGHGPSMDGSNRGEKIDSFDKVVRLKGTGKAIGSNDFGNKTDALVASTEVLGLFFKVECPEYWAYPKNGTYNKESFLSVVETLEKPVMLPLETSNFWKNQFQKMGASFPSMSTGMAGLIFALHRWKPDEAYLAGFDTMMNPDTVFSRTKSVPRTGVGEFPPHDWKTENKLLEVLEKYYNVKIMELE